MNILINTIIQIVLFSLIPLIWWLVTGRKESFFLWIGLKGIKIENKKVFLYIFIGIMIVFMILAIFILYMIKDVQTATSQFAHMGAKALLPVLIYSFFQTALAEEILFRGFLCKRLSNKFGITIGNLVQSIIFGLVHGVLFFSLIEVWKVIIVIAFTGGIGYAMGYLNEKKAGGSILPSWIIHGLSNLFSSVISMLNLI